MSLCCGKREKNESAEEELASALGNTIKNFPLEDLRDELLVEILRRLPAAKSAVGFKLVSKRWSSLISTPYFRSQFITHHININKDNHYHAICQFITRSAVFISPRRNRQQDYKLDFITGKEDPIFESAGFTLEFLPEERKFVSVVATCNDLMLCRARKEGCMTNYYICNPFTMKWLLLSPPPISDCRGDDNFGLVYEPNYKRWIQGINQCRFRVVCIKSSRKESYVLIHIYTYCSETGQWNKSPQLGAEYYVSGNIVAHYGKLHWRNGRDVVAYDPFNSETFFMELFDSQGEPYRSRCKVGFCLGICQGFLQVIKSVKYINRGDASDYLSVWELKGPEARSLVLKNKIFFSIDSYVVHYRSSRPRPLFFQPIAFHPDNKDVVYLQSCDFKYENIITCKIQGGKLEEVSKSLYPMRCTCNREVFTTALPWWPTPVPMLPQNAHV